MLIRIVLTLILLSPCMVAQSDDFGAQSAWPQWRVGGGQGLLHRGLFVYGEIHAGNSSMQGWTIELLPLKGGKFLETTPWQRGIFEFRAVTPGEYRLRVKNARGIVLHEEEVSLNEIEKVLSVTVQPEEFEGPADTISIQQLQHRPPGKALKAWRNGQAAFEKRKIALAADHLKTAVALDPAFADAHNDLGTVYFHLGQYQESAEHFQKAIDLAPAHRQANDNLCFVLVKSGRYAEAGQAADQILKLGRGSAMAHYAAALGLLAVSGSPIEKTMAHLRAAQRQIPNAHLIAGSILADAGRRADAARELEAYLRSGSGESKRAELEAWLAELRQ